MLTAPKIKTGPGASAGFVAEAGNARRKTTLHGVSLRHNVASVCVSV